MIPYALPPAETRLPWRAMVSALRPGAVDFAERLSDYLQADRCLLANSGKAVLYTVFRSLRDRADRDRTDVLVPGYTCYSVAAAAVKASLKVAPYDLDPHTFQPDWDDLRRKLSGRSLAVVFQHLLGVPTESTKMAELAHQHGACCIEDSAQRLTRPCSPSAASSSADFTIFSFSRGKPLPLGAGGALIGSSSAELPIVNGQSTGRRHSIGPPLLPIAVRILSNPRLYWMLEKLPLGLGRTIYDPTFPVSTMPLGHQRIGTSALAALDRLNEHRATIGGVYREHFAASTAGATLGGCVPYLRYPLLVSNQCDAARLARHGVRTFYPLALCDLPALQEHLADGEHDTPGAREIARRLVTLPTHSGVSIQTARELAAEASKLVGR